MYHIYAKNESAIGEVRKLVGEFQDLDDAYDRVDAELAKNKDFKYVIEQTNGAFDSYGELLTTVIEEN